MLWYMLAVVIVFIAGSFTTWKVNELMNFWDWIASIFNR